MNGAKCNFSFQFDILAELDIALILALNNLNPSSNRIHEEGRICIPMKYWHWAVARGNIKNSVMKVGLSLKRCISNAPWMFVFLPRSKPELVARPWKFYQFQ